MHRGAVAGLPGGVQMKLLSALKKGKWVRRKGWLAAMATDADRLWLQRTGHPLVDAEGWGYTIDFGDLEATDWEIKQCPKRK